MQARVLEQAQARVLEWDRELALEQAQGMDQVTDQGMDRAEVKDLERGRGREVRFEDFQSEADHSSVSPFSRFSRLLSHIVESIA